MTVGTLLGHPGALIRSTSEINTETFSILHVLSNFLSLRLKDYTHMSLRNGPICLFYASESPHKWKTHGNITLIEKYFLSNIITYNVLNV